MTLDLYLYETALDISTRWTSEHPRYKEALKSVKQQKYDRALAELQRLVIKRLLELQRLNVSHRSE